MVDIRIPHQVIYEVPDSTAISDIIASLRAAEQLFFEVPGLLESLVPDLHVGGVRVKIESLTQTSPLRELFWFTVAVAFQPTMERDLPVIVQQLFGAHIPEQYDSVIALLFCLLVVYGGEFIFKQVNRTVDSRYLRGQLDRLVSELATECKIEESRIRSMLENRFEKRRLSNLIKSTISFFAPSKRQGNAPILIGARRLDSDTVSEFPSDARLQEFDDEETTQALQNVEIELHAQDIDRTRVGWAGVIKEVSPDRLRMSVYPPITPADIYTKEKIIGDVIVMYRRAADGEMEPYMFHLIRLG